MSSIHLLPPRNRFRLEVAFLENGRPAHRHAVLRISIRFLLLFAGHYCGGRTQIAAPSKLVAAPMSMVRLD